MSLADTEAPAVGIDAGATGSVARPFRVLIAGGSIIGLTLANALDKAGIDFLVLEKRTIAPDLGAAISMSNSTSKVFDQLGVLPAMEAYGVPLTRWQRVDGRTRQSDSEGGRIIEDSALFDHVTAVTGRKFYFLQRKDYLVALHGNLSNPAKQVKENCGVVRYEELNEADGGGVRVTTTTGEVVEGSILVGCDGVHSAVREQMAEQFRESDPQRAKGLREAFTSSYSAIFGTTPNSMAEDAKRLMVPEGIVRNTLYQDVSVIISSGVPGRTFWFLFIKEDQPTTTPNCAKYTDADAEAAVEKYGDLMMADGVSVRDLWKRKTKAVMVPMEAGVVSGSWNNGGRVVLLGDSATKATANLGFGGNTNIEAVCHFVNELVPLVRNNSSPSSAELAVAFTRYEKKHRARAETTVSISNFVTRFDALDAWYMMLLARIMAWVPDSLKSKGFIAYANGAPTIDYLPDPDAARK